MFGADTALVFDALQMVVVAALATGGVVYAVMHRRNNKHKTTRNREAIDSTPKSNLEQRVEVLERIATDRSIDLAEEIEALREPALPTTDKAQGGA